MCRAFTTHISAIHNTLYLYFYICCVRATWNVVVTHILSYGRQRNRDIVKVTQYQMYAVSMAAAAAAITAAIALQ